MGILTRVHPVSKNLILVMLAKCSWAYLLFAFIIFSIFYSFIFMTSLSIISNREGLDELLDLLKIGFLFFWSYDSISFDVVDDNLWLFLFLASFIKLLVQALFLGSIVSKLLIPQDVFKKKNFMNIYWERKKCYWSASIRLYNATSLEVADLEFSLYLRRPYLREVCSDGRNSHKSPVDPVVANKPILIADEKDNWPISIPKVPYSIVFDLLEGDVCHDKDGKPVLRSIQGNLISPDNTFPQDQQKYNGCSFLVLLINGKIPHLGTNLFESHWTKLTDRNGSLLNSQFGHFKDVAVLPGDTEKKAFGRPKEWDGWEAFEEADDNDYDPLVPEKERKHYIFGYGSLIDVNALEKFLVDHGCAADIARETRDKARPCRLTGFERSWNVAMENKKEIAGYKRYRDPKSREFDDIYVTFLNIKKSEKENSYVFGIVYEVTKEIIYTLDNRERNYWRTQIMKKSLYLNKGDQLFHPGDVIWTYIAQPSGIDRFLTGQRSGKAFIQEQYLERFENALREHSEEYKAYKKAGVPRDEGDLVGKVRSLERVDF